MGCNVPDPVRSVDTPRALAERSTRLGDCARSEEDGRVLSRHDALGGEMIPITRGIPFGRGSNEANGFDFPWGAILFLEQDI